MPDPFASLPLSPPTHFNAAIYAAVLRVLRQVTRLLGTREVACQQFPFLEGYLHELRAYGLDGVSVDDTVAWWDEKVRSWEATSTDHLPLRALRETCDLSHETLTILLCVGLVEEDGRFGLLFEALHGLIGQRRPTLGLLQAWSLEASGTSRANLRELQRRGLIQPTDPSAPRSEWVLYVPALLWDALRGEQATALAPWCSYEPSSQLVALDALIISDSLQPTLLTLPDLIRANEVGTVVVRGPQHNGRHTLLGSLARELGLGLLRIDGSLPDLNWQLAGLLSTMLHAMPVLTLDLSPGETADLPILTGYSGPAGIVLGQQGGVHGSQLERAITLTLALPDAGDRAQHWQQALAATPIHNLPELSAHFRMTGGNIRRAAPLARSYARLDHRTSITLADVQQASRALHRQALDTLAQPVKVGGDWSQLAVRGETLRDLYALERRCRHRERLYLAVGEALGGQMGPGVRALFNGPSGTGKTLAARLLAAELQMELYRVDLASVVNKYIGETEKNLSRLFARAEELDVILLLDEGDALLTQRTNVHSANDRYANLETNYLLQRLETYEGILIITTNAGDRIDGAFQRRMDVVVEFRRPDIEERWAIWQLHLPATHAIDHAMLEETVERCTLTGGQIRNAVLHAALLALDDGGLITNLQLEAAVQREYRKLGAICPLRPPSFALFDELG